MSNLLDKSSIVLTPTAYDNGKVLCVKPSDGSGDFDFSRNSAATRVNAQGLVEDVQILSSDLVQNGSFSQLGSQEITNGSFSQQGTEQVLDGSFANGDADWNRENSVFTISGGVANGNGANGGSEELSQNFSQDLTAGKTYKIVFELLNYVSGSVQFALTGGGSLFGTSQSADGTFTQYVVALGNNNKIKFRGANFNGSITSISLVEVGQDWTLGTGWSIGEDKATFDNSSQAYLSQGSVFSLTSTYKITFTISNMVSGFIQFPSAFYSNPLTASSNGDYTFYTQATNTSLFILGGAGTNGSVTNISVKEVGQDWDLTGTWTIGDNVANCDGSQSGNADLIQALPTGAGKQYKITYTISNYLAGDIKVRFSSGNTTSAQSSNGTFTEIITAAANGGFRLRGNDTFNGSVTNIKIIEITDDTNLPRINYEGFSYQDALGSEEIVNGDFATDTNWNKGTGWTISGGTANGLATFNPIQQVISGFTAGKKYKVSFEITELINGFIRVYSYVGASGTFTQVLATPSQTGTYEVIFEFGGTNKNLFFYGNAGGGNFTGSIDNVSVKEYLGQEVVPDSGCGSWLWEPQSTNLITQSELFSDSVWTKSGASVTSGFSSPDGANNAYKMMENTSNSVHKLQIINGVSNAFQSQSIFVKYDNSQQFIQTTSSRSISNYVNFDILNKTFSNFGTSQGKITEYTDGWLRLDVYHDSSTTVYWHFVTSLTAAWSESYLGTEKYLQIWGAQVEALSYSTSYIPTSGQASGVTRNQDVCIGGGSAASMNSSQGVLYAEIAALADTDTANRTIALSENNTTNRLELRLTLSGTIEARFDSLSSDISLIKTGIDVSNTNKIALFWESGKCALWVNGIKEQENLTFNTFPLNSLFNFSFLSPFAGGSNNFFGKTKCLAVWKEALTDTELQELTTI